MHPYILPCQVSWNFQLFNWCVLQIFIQLNCINAFYSGFCPHNISLIITHYKTSKYFKFTEKKWKSKITKFSNGSYTYNWHSITSNYHGNLNFFNELYWNTHRYYISVRSKLKVTHTIICQFRRWFVEISTVNY